MQEVILEVDLNTQGVVKLPRVRTIIVEIITVNQIDEVCWIIGVKEVITNGVKEKGCGSQKLLQEFENTNSISLRTEKLTGNFMPKITPMAS